MANILYVTNPAQKALFEHEIKGQLSDGHWENASPGDHWKPWCEAEVRVALSENQQGRNFYARRDNYNLLNKDLLDVVANRMILIVKIIKAFGEAHFDAIFHLFDFDENWIGQITYEGAYYDKLRTEINNLFPTAESLDNAKEKIESQEYTMRDLRSDLKELKAIMKTEI